MLSLSRFSQNVFPIFRLVNDGKTVLEIVYKRKVYEFYIIATDKKPNLRRPRQFNRKEITELTEALNCEYCNSLTVAGICMNTHCPTNKH